MRKAFAWLMPRGYADLRARRSRERVLAVRDQRLAAGRAAAGARPAAAVSVDEAVCFLVARGLSEAEVRAGSLPQPSLDFLAGFMASELPAERPLLALHVGNFVGVSLAHLSATLAAVHPDSRVWSIDPDIPHREIEGPADHAFALLGRFDLLAHNVVLTGYTLEQNTGDDSEEDPVQRFEAERRPEQLLPSLVTAGLAFDLVFIDGNHDGRYLARELEQVRRLLRPGALVAIDDVDEAVWPMVVEVFEGLAGQGDYDELGRDDRIGVLRYRRT